MSDNDNGDMAKAKGGKTMSWTEHEVLVYLLSAMEHSSLKIDFATAPVPFGRNASGCMQKIGKMKTALRAEIDALKAGEPIPAAEGTPKKKATPRKRKAKGEDENGNGSANGSPKKRGRAKKTAKVEEEEEDLLVKSEMKSEGEQVEDEI